MTDHTLTPYFPQDLENYAPWVAKYGLLYPYGLCQCGCMEKTNISPANHARLNQRKGHPYRFARNHHVRNSVDSFFWANLKKCDDHECWVWQGSLDPDGYGIAFRNGKGYRAHRVSYEIHHGAIPAGYLILHSCDNPSCCNPNHLRAGTPQDNSTDMVSKNRSARRGGETNINARFTNEQAEKIRLEYPTLNISIEAYAKRYGVCRETMRLIIRGKTYQA